MNVIIRICSLDRFKIFTEKGLFQISNEQSSISFIYLLKTFILQSNEMQITKVLLPLLFMLLLLLLLLWESQKKRDH
jgi:hypothetical protein